MSNSVWDRIVVTARVELGIDLGEENRSEFQHCNAIRDLVEDGEYVRAVYKWSALYA